jgi:GPH family glycoside/pentoside/hexuronide:cation symporter
VAGSARPGGLRLVAFSITGLAIGGAGVPLAIYLPAFYAQNMGLNLGLVGTIFMVSRLWNALSDPVVGALSDRTQSRFGRRRPWIGIGGVLFILSALFVFMPGPHVSPWQLMLSLFGLYLGWSMVSTPLYAWSGDLSGEYHQRTRVQTYVQTMAALGLALVLLIPTILDWLGDPAPARKIALMGWFVILALGIGIPTLILFFRENSPGVRGRPSRSVAALWPVIANPLVLRVMGSDFFVALGQGFRSGLFVFFVSAYMGLPQWAGLLYLIQFIFGIFAAPIWMRIGYRLGKHRTVALGEITQIAVNLALLALSPGQLAPLIALTVIQGLSQGSGNLMLRAIVADVADAHRLETGEERSGFLFSIFNVTTNAAMALALGISFPILSWLGFVPGAHNSPAALTSLHLFFAIGPALGHSLSALLIWRFPLDATRHAEIADALRRKKLAEARHGPLTGSWTGRSTAIPFPRSPSELLPETVK